MSRTKPLPPLMVAAFDRLTESINGPLQVPCWPITNTPRIQQLVDDARRAGAKPGPKSKVTLKVAAQLTGLIEQGASLRVAAKAVGISTGVAHRVVSGTHPVWSVGAQTKQRTSPPIANGPRKAGMAFQINSEHSASTKTATDPIDAPIAGSAHQPEMAGISA